MKKFLSEKLKLTENKNEGIILLSSKKNHNTRTAHDRLAAEAQTGVTTCAFRTYYGQVCNNHDNESALIGKNCLLLGVSIITPLVSEVPL
mgnify:CR=1 FL=1